MTYRADSRMAGREKRSAEKRSWLERVKKNLRKSSYRTKLWETFWICGSFVIIGIVYGQRGPSFLDLQMITNTNVEEVSQFFTSQSAGYIAGAIVAGVLYDHYPDYRWLLHFGVTFLMAVATIAIPWCSNYVAMVVMFFLCAAFMGALDISINTSMLDIWGVHGTPYMQTAHFAYAVGAFIVPLFTEPFLTPLIALQQNLTYSPISNCNVFNQNYFNGSQSVQEVTLVKLRNGYESINTGLKPESIKPENSVHNFTYMLEKLDCSIKENSSESWSDMFGDANESRLYIAYLISGMLCLLSSFPFIVLFCKSKSVKRHKQKRKGLNSQDGEHRRGRSIPHFAFILLLTAIMYGLEIAIETAFGNFLLAFVVRRLTWTKSAASVLTSMFWAAFASGRFLCIWTSTFVTPVRMLAICCTSLTIAMMSFTLCALYMVHPGIWVFVCFCGATMAPLFPTGLMWIEQDLFKFSGKLFSVIVFASSIGAIVNPPVMGYLLEHFTQMWYVYLQLVECVAFVIIFFSLNIFARVSKIPKSTEGYSINVSSVVDQEEEEQEPVMSETEDEITGVKFL